MQYYVNMFGGLMTITPMFYSEDTVEPSVFVLADVNEDEDPVFARIPIRAIVYAQNAKKALKRFKASGLSKQRLTKHFLLRVADENDFFDHAPAMSKVAELPTLDKIEQLLSPKERQPLKLKAKDIAKAVDLMRAADDK